MSDVVTVAAGYAHTCALRKDSKVFCWGANESGQLGLPASSDDVLRPAEVTSLPAIRKLALGGEFSCAITSDDRVVCWGDDQVGQLGDGAAGGSRYTPSYVKTEDGSDLRFVTDLGATIGSACALTSSGVKGVHCWGYNHRSQLGRPSSEIAQSPAALLVPSSSSAMMLAVGETTVHFVAGDTICGWGANTGSAITNGGGSVTTPTCFTLSSVLQTVLGGGNGCARLTSGDVRCWGYTLGSPTMQPPPGMVLPGIAAVGLGGGTSHLCGVDTTATVKCWGFNAMGALGDGTSQDSTAPRTVLNAQGSVLSDVLPGGISLGGTSSHSCAVLGDGSLYCWGANEQGQVGSGVATAAERRAVPVRW